MKSQNCKIQYKHFLAIASLYLTIIKKKLSQNWKFISCNCNLTSHNCNFMSQFSLSCEIKKSRLLILLVYSVAITDFHEILLQITSMHWKWISKKGPRFHRGSESDTEACELLKTHASRNEHYHRLPHRSSAMLYYPSTPAYMVPPPPLARFWGGWGWQTDLACPLTVTLMHWGSRD